MVEGIVGSIAFEVTDSYGLACHLVVDTLRLALFLLRAYASAHGGQRAALLDDVVGVDDMSSFYVLDESGYVDVDGTSLSACGVSAVEASLCFLLCHERCESLVDLIVERVSSGHGVELRHLDSGYSDALFGFEGLAELHTPWCVAVSVVGLGNGLVLVLVFGGENHP